MLALEDACFAPRSRTRVLALTESQIAAYRRAWRTPTERIVLLPPAIEAARRCPEFRNDGTHERMRRELGLGEGVMAMLSIGTSPRTKGFDRIVAARSPRSLVQRILSAACRRRARREPRCSTKPTVSVSPRGS